MPSAPAPSRAAHPRWLPAAGVLLWLVAAVGGWLLARRAGWTAGELVLAGAVWVLVLLVAARQFLRDLFGPVFVYEVMRVGRRLSTFIFRWLYIGIVVGLLVLLYFSWSYAMDAKGYRGGNVPPVELARFATIYFEAVAVAQFIVVVLLTPGYVAGTISNEKERQTLEFLLATDLRNREIVFGKLAARTITLSMYVLAGLPVLAFLQLFGGIDPDLALASTAAAVITVVGLSAVSLAFSTALKKSRDAIAVTYLVVIGYLAVSFTVALVVKESLVRTNDHLSDFGLFVIDWQAVTKWLAAGNAVYTFENETRGGRVIDGDVISSMLGKYAAFWGLVTLLALLYAVLRLRVIALRQGHGEPRTLKANAAAAERPDMGNDPVTWREVFGGKRRVGVGGWVFRFVVVALVAVVPAIGAYQCFYADRMWSRTFEAQWADFIRGMSIWVRMTTGVLTTIILFGVALRGAASIAGERDKDTWISLISAPLTPLEVLSGKWLGCVLSMRFAYAVLLGVWAVGLALRIIHPAMLLATVVLVALYASAFSMLGIVCSLTAKTTLGASVRAFAATLFMAGGFWLVFLVCCVLPVGISGSGGSRTLDIPTAFLLGGTPPFMAGWAPLRDFDQAGMGPFHPRELEGVGPLGPILGTVVWVGILILLTTSAHHMLIRQMNRQTTADPDPTWREDEPPRRPRPKARRAE